MHTAEDRVLSPDTALPHGDEHQKKNNRECELTVPRDWSRNTENDKLENNCFFAGHRADHFCGERRPSEKSSAFSWAVHYTSMRSFRSKFTLSASELLEWGSSAVDPCEDFYEFACGNYGNGLIGSAYSFWNQFRYTQQHVDAATKENNYRVNNIFTEILSQPSSCEEPAAVRMAKHAYQACMDEDTLAERGTSPLLKMLETFGGWPVLSKGFKGENCCGGQFGWTDISRGASQLGIKMIFDIIVSSNFFNSSQMVIYVQHDTLPTPVPLMSSWKIEPSEALPWDYVDDQNIQGMSPTAPVVDNLYVRYLTRMVKAIWDSRPSSELNDYPNRDDVDESVKIELRKVTLLMQKLKALSKYIGDSSNIAKRIYKKGLKTASGLMTIATLQNYTDTIFPNPKYKLDWLDFLQKLFIHSNVILTSRDLLYVESVDKLMKAIYVVETTDERTLQNFIGSRIVSYLGPETTDELWKTAKWFYQELKYITEEYSRYFTDIFHIAFVELLEMVMDLKVAFKELMEENDWMDNKTKAYALEKADAMMLLLGFPDWLSDRKKLDAFYKNLAIDSYAHFGNVVRLRSFEYSQGLKVLREGQNRNTWTQAPLIVNAFYNTLNNRITFPAGVMNRPFFYGSDVEALNYGRIGSIVGHEITHGFDSTGRRFDKNGTFTNWWTPEVEDKYKAKAQCFIDQYSNFTDPYTNKTVSIKLIYEFVYIVIYIAYLKVNGLLTLPENIADNGGLREAYRAFTQMMLPRREKDKSKMQMSMDCYPKSGARLPGLQQYTEDQLFFLGFATTWCDVGRSAQAKASNDNHAPNKFRVLGSVSNMAEFAKAWSCPEGSPMNPKKKCVLW
ncbi:hypothetical protein J437_LFUL003689 [Ladona fulva]|uniref:Endothelin-converting enzyme 1 n=1 Tax=Ladona fulva TaxID=123851 RepID=A0A8K0NVG5_LADFU|nr:hypothetical protein J437_LFUL003689 [Ladona fulva]